jgi:Ca2+-binding EF-hand superfamily protein
MSIEIAAGIADFVDDDDLKQLWATLDADGDGKVTSKEWGSKVYRNQEIMSKYFGGHSLSEIGHAFNRIDADKRGSLSLEEFATGAKSYAAAVKIAMAAKTDIGRAELKELWDQLDKNGDGKISSKEWGQGVYKNQKILRNYFGTSESTLKEIGQTFNRINTNGDEYLTWTEFISEVDAYATVIQLKKVMETEEGAAELKALFETLDKDGDGKVSGKEWGSAVYKNQDILKKYFGGSSLKEIGETFNRIDVDNSDSLTWDEFVRDTQL